MSRFWKVILSLTIPLLLILVGVVFFFGPDYRSENYRTAKIVSAAQSVPTTKINFGIIYWNEKVADDPGHWDGKIAYDPGVKAAIRRLSQEIKKNGNSANIELSWAHTKNPDDMEAIVDYYPSVQVLTYSPEVVGTTFRYEGVKPEYLHQLAARQSKIFYDLKQFGCSVAEYDNDDL